MEQRNFAFLQALPAPANADSRILSLCQTESDALILTLRFKGEKFSAAWFASRLGVSASYLSQMRHGKPIPEWIVRPLCVLAGTNLLSQYRTLRAALRIATNAQTERDRIDMLVREMRSAA